MGIFPLIAGVLGWTLASTVALTLLLSRLAARNHPRLSAIGLMAAVALPLGSWVPALWFSMLGTAVQASLHLGYWPSYGNPDPRLLHEVELPGLSFLFSFVVTLGLWVPYALALARCRSMKWAGALSLLSAAALFGAGVLLIYIDPFGAFDWFMD